MDQFRISRANRYEREVLALEQTEKLPGRVVFYGDSSFTRWSTAYGMKPLEEVITGVNGEPIAVNHGLGGSTSEDLLYYYDRMVRAWQPKALVLHAFANDYCYGYSPREIMGIQERIFAYARCDMPGIRIYACQVRPIIKDLGDIVHWRAYMARVNEYNGLLKDYCDRHDDCVLVDHIQSPLFFREPQEAGSYEGVRRDIFVEDQVHFNQLGYDLYGDFFGEILKQERLAR